jgi:arsenate reductase
MYDVGYDLSHHTSKSLAEIPNICYEKVITMGCGDQCAVVEAVSREDWDIPDPRDMDNTGFMEVRDLIKDRVIQLLDRIEPG